MNNELRKLWIDAGYRPKMGSAAVVPPPAKSVIRVYHVTAAEHGISSIALGRLKLSRFSDLNDPFELLAVNFRERHVRKIIRDWKEKYDSQTGLLCFSADWTSPMLWTHYGAKHRGVCLGFDLSRSLAEPVKYEDERLRAALEEDGDPTRLPEDLQKQLLCTKFGNGVMKKKFVSSFH